MPVFYVMEKFLKKISDYIEANSLIDTEKIVVAFSGGADSAALLDALCLLKESGNIKAEIFAAHINHNLRGNESDGDQKFAENFALQRQVKIKSENVDIETYCRDNNVSTETAARELRRKAICKIASEFGAKTIATAHHKDDNAETMIHRLSRGTGLKGLGGIWPSRNINIDGHQIRYIRPLLCVNRHEIEEYCKSRGIDWRHDSSNDELIYTRNVIRHSILPKLEENSANCLRNKLYKLADSSRRLYEKVFELARSAWNESVSIAEDDEVVIEAISFNLLPIIVRQEIIRLAYNRLGGSESKITSSHYDNIIEFAAGTDSAKLQLPCDIYCFRGYGRIIFRKIVEHGIAFTIINSPGTYKFKDNEIVVSKESFNKKMFKDFIRNKKSNEEWFDAATVKLPICVRSRETGDKFRPIGQRTPKRVGKFLIGARIDHAQRAKIVIFEDDNKNIIWIAPHRASDITKISDDTQEVYKIKVDKIQD